MGGNCLAEMLGRYASLSAAECSALAALEIGRRACRKGAVIRSEHQPADEIFVVQSGWLFCSLLLEDGRRQIIRLHFRGDLLGADSLAFRDAPDAICALTDCEVDVIDRAALGRIFTDHPRLGALLFALQQVDRVMMMDRLASLGRNSAKGRVAALLLWVHGRLKLADPTVESFFALPLTQEEIGDATGLTAVHVNRTMRALTEQKLIGRSGGMVRLLDIGRLARVANHVQRSETFDTGWLPPAR